MGMVAGWRRLIWPAIPFSVQVVLQLSGYQNPVVAAVLLALTLVLLLVAEWPRLRRIRVRFTVLPDPQTTATTNPLGEDLARISQLEHENKDLRAANMRLRGDLNEARAGYENKKALSKELWQELKYGEQLPPALRLEPEDFARMLDHVHELKPSLRDTVAGADQVWAHLSALIRARADNLPWKLLAWRLDRLDATEHKHLEQIVNTFERLLENKEDPRPFLAGTYKRYRNWRDQMADVAETFGHPLALTPGCIPWMAAERRFLDELHRKLAVPVLHSVKKVVDEYDQKNGRPEDLSQVR